ncbi:hypothetical protein LPB73_07335 [Tardiphaga sp. 37S4]|uniref:hypothetical protein n=1 Tax=Tardiphaga sp. 37S4 TaxID=1404741 RepID=UPI001E391C97|nr:hypothetical protein [Tardiphaga sp. 37S4]UFS77181.1 hypothetical protein LPB73_07335 [Tardiphaga sp. 37S4]
MSTQSDCKFCRTTPNAGEPSSCQTLEQAYEQTPERPCGCPWFDQEDRKRNPKSAVPESVRDAQCTLTSGSGANMVDRMTPEQVADWRDEGNCNAGAAAQCAQQTRMPDEEAMRRLSANELACYHWPEDTAEHRALRAAFMDGAAITPAQCAPQPSGERCECEGCDGSGVDNYHQTWPGTARCRYCNGTGTEPAVSCAAREALEKIASISGGFPAPEGERPIAGLVSFKRITEIARAAIATLPAAGGEASKREAEIVERCAAEARKVAVEMVNSLATPPNIRGLGPDDSHLRYGHKVAFIIETAIRASLSLRKDG